MTFDEARAYLLKRAEAEDVDAEIIADETRELTLDAFGGVLSETTQAVRGGLGLRVIKDGKTGYASSEELTQEALDWVLSEAVENAELQSSGEAALPAGRALGYQDLLSEGLSAPADEKGEAALAFEGNLRSDPQLKQVVLARYSEKEYQFALSSTKGAEGGYRNGYAAIGGVALLVEGESIKQGYDIKVERDFHLLEPGNTAQEILAKTRRHLGAKPLTSGRYTAYFEPKAFTQLFGLLEYMLSGKTLAEGKSRFLGKLGKQVANTRFTLVDDATLDGGLASRPFDSEGVLSQRLELIESGVLKAFMHNTATAAKTGHQSTGHASRSYKGVLEVSSSNLFLAPGEGVDVRNGVVITGLSGLHAGANPITGDISLQALGLKYEAGELVYPVENFVISGNLCDWLLRIASLGSAVEWYQTKAAPMVEIPDVSFAGS